MTAALTQPKPCPNRDCATHELGIRPVENWNLTRRTAQIMCDVCRTAGPEVRCDRSDDEDAWDEAREAWDRLPR